MAPACSMASRMPPTLCAGRIIHHHDIAGGEFGNEYLLDVSSERLTVHRSVEHHGSGDAGEPETGSCGCCLPVAVRHSGTAAFAAGRPAVEAGHLG